MCILQQITKLELKTNVHPNTDGSPWGWVQIEGTRIEVARWSGHGDKNRWVNIVTAVNEYASLKSLIDAYEGTIVDKANRIKEIESEVERLKEVLRECGKMLSNYTYSGDSAEIKTYNKVKSTLQNSGQ